MTLSRRHILCAAGGLMAAWPAKSLAHRARLSLTTIVWNPRTSSLEVTHRLHLHDAVQALPLAPGDGGHSFADLKDRARFALYIEERFSLKDETGERLELDIVGAELESDYIFVYQEQTRDAAPRKLTCECQIMQDVFADQINHLNIEINGLKTSMTFQSGDSREQSWIDPRPA